MAARDHNDHSQETFRNSARNFVGTTQIVVCAGLHDRRFSKFAIGFPSPLRRTLRGGQQFSCRSPEMAFAGSQW